MHERCKTGECSVTTATLCTTTVAAVFGPRWRAKIDDPHPEQKLYDDAKGKIVEKRKQ